MDKEIFTLLGELYFNMVKQNKLLQEKDAESKIKDQMIKDLKDKLNGSLNNRGVVANTDS